MNQKRFSKGAKEKIYPGNDSLDEITLIYPYNVSLEDQMGSLGKKVTLSVDQVMTIFKDLAYSLKKLHTKNILYLALKPSNVFFDQTNLSYVLGR